MDYKSTGGPHAMTPNASRVLIGTKSDLVKGRLADAQSAIHLLKRYPDAST